MKGKKDALRDMVRAISQGGDLTQPEVNLLAVVAEELRLWGFTSDVREERVRRLAISRGLET